MKKFYVLLAFVVTIILLSELFVSAQNSPIRVQSMANKRLTDHLLNPNQDWLRYYSTAPYDQIQLYYNVSILLDMTRRQEATIQSLTKRIEVLEQAFTKQGLELGVQGSLNTEQRTPNTEHPKVKGPGSTAPEPNAVSSPANSGGPAKEAAD